MAGQISAKKCGKADCQVAKTGSCAEGHAPLESCPNYLRQFGGSHVYDGELDPATEGATPDIERVSLPSGEALTFDEVGQFLLWRDATFVAVIGDSHSGKTTLVCALYERFLKGPFAGLGFAGSRTLVALERRSHHSRVESGRITPDTAHTSLQEGLRYFHFAVAPNGQPEKRTDLLLSDRSGEVYREVRDNSNVVGTLPEIPQADRTVLLLDGRRVADPIERNGAIQSARQILRVLLDNGALDLTSIVQVVTTKFDLIAAGPDVQQIDNVLAAFRERLFADFALRLKSLSFHDIAARDPTTKFAPAHGSYAGKWVMTV
jgi:Double-GTPase 2